jgi:hypothetical protein
MSKTHLQTAHEHGIKTALAECGYASVEDVQRDAQALGLNGGQKTAAPAQTSGDFLSSLKAKLGR